MKTLVLELVCLLNIISSSGEVGRLLVVVLLLSRVQPFATPWTVAHQALLSMGFSRQEYRSGLPFPSPGDLPDPGIKPASSPLAGGFFTTQPPGKPKELVGLPKYTKGGLCLPETGERSKIIHNYSGNFSNLLHSPGRKA